MKTFLPPLTHRTTLLLIVLAAILTVLIILTLMVLAVSGLVVMLNGGMSRGFSGSWTRLGVSAVILLGAIALYVVKKSRAQVLYGLGEVAVGVFANWRSLDAFMPSNAVANNALFARLAILAGGLYLIGRGIDNVLDGVRKIFPVSWAEFRDGFKKSYHKSPGAVTSWAAFIGAFKKGYHEPTGISLQSHALVPRSLKQFWLETLRDRASAITLEFQDPSNSTWKRMGKISGVGKTTFQISWEDGGSQDFPYDVPTTKEGPDLRLVYPSGDVMVIPLLGRTTHSTEAESA